MMVAMLVYCGVHIQRRDSRNGWSLTQWWQSIEHIAGDNVSVAVSWQDMSLTPTR